MDDQISGLSQQESPKASTKHRRLPRVCFYSIQPNLRSYFDMPKNEQHQQDHGPSVSKRRRRLLAHLGIFTAAGVALVTLGPSSTSAAPTVQEGRYLSGGNLNVPYVCEGADAGSINLMTAILPAGVVGPDVPAPGKFVLGTTLITTDVTPAPSPGEDFVVNFTYNEVLPFVIVDAAFAVNPTLSVDANIAIAAVSGATGSGSFQGANTIDLGDGTLPVGFTVGPNPLTFNRTAAIDEPISFKPGPFTSSSTTSVGPLNLVCNPQDSELLLTVSDQTGVAPVTTSTTLQPVVPTTAGPPATVNNTSTTALPRTGSGTSNLYLVLLALGLLDVGYLALTASNSPRSRRA